MIGILFEKRIVDDSSFPRTPDRPVELLGTRVRYSRSVKTTIGARGPDFLGGSATVTWVKWKLIWVHLESVNLGVRKVHGLCQMYDVDGNLFGGT